MTNLLRILKPNIENNINVIWLGIFLFFLAVSAPWFNLAVSNHAIVKSYFASFGISSLLLLGLYYKCKVSKISLKINFIKLSLTLLFIFGTLSSLWTINFDITVGKWLLWLISAFSFLLALNLSINHLNLIKISWCFIIAAATIAIIGLLQYYFDPFSLREATKIASTFGNKNLATEALVLIFPFSIFLLFSKYVQGIKVWILLGIASLILTYLIFSMTRASWISVIIELFLISLYLTIRRSEIISWIDWGSNKQKAVIVSVAITLVLLNISPFGEIDNSLLDDISQRISTSGNSAIESSITMRIQIWHAGIKMIFDSPLIGTGLGSFSQNLVNEGYASWIINNTMHAHNDLIELAVELGLFGLTIFFIVIISLIIGIVDILKKTTGEIHLFYLIILICLIGSFINLLISSPYQSAFPLVLFGLFSGLIAKKLDQVSQPLKIIKFSIIATHKKIILFISSVVIFIIYFFTYFQWIIAYDQLDKISRSKDFSQLEIINTPIYEIQMQSSLYSLGGKYFLQEDFIQSRVIDQKFLEVWPNHLDVLYRTAYAAHKLGQNSVALKLAKKLKKIEPVGLYYGHLVEMFIYLDTNEISKLEQTFNHLISQPEKFLVKNESTYRLMIFFTLASKNLSKYAPSLYEKFIENHDYSCEVQNNIAIHYFNLQEYKRSAQYVNKTINIAGVECLNPELIKHLNEMNLLEESKS